MNWYIPSLIFSALFSENLLFARYLGICSATTMTGRPSLALGMGLSVTAVLTLATPFAWLMHREILEPAGLHNASTVIYVMLIAGLVQLMEKMLTRHLPALQREMGIFLPLIAVNCAILGGVTLISSRSCTLVYSLVWALASGIGWTLAVVLLAYLRGSVDQRWIPESFRGLPLTLILTALASLPFSGFSGMMAEEPVLDAAGAGVSISAGVSPLAQISGNPIAGTLLLWGGIFSILKLFSHLSKAGTRNYELNLDGESLSHQAREGESLMAALERAGVNLPAACGGKGSCGLCGVGLVDWPLPPSQLDLQHFTPSQLEKGMRLACSTRISGPVTVKVPREARGTSEKARVESITKTALETFIIEVIIKPENAENWLSLLERVPCFLILELPDLKPWTRRAYSVLSYQAHCGAIRIKLLVRRVSMGLMSGFLTRLKKGFVIKALGPFPEFALPLPRPRGNNYVLAGGTGIVPALNIISHLTPEQLGSTELILGFKSISMIPAHLPEIPVMKHSLKIVIITLEDKAANNPATKGEVLDEYFGTLSSRVEFRSGNTLTALKDSLIRDADSSSNDFTPGMAMLAGPPAMVRQGRLLLAEFHWSPENILGSEF